MKKLFYSVLVVALALIVIVPTAVLACYPTIHIEKYTMGCDGKYGDGVNVIAGSTVTWKYVVTNTGEAGSYLTTVTVTDNMGVTLGAPVKTGGDTDGLLEIGETWTYYATGTAIAGQYNNSATATGCYSSIKYTDSDDSSYFGGAPEISIVKTTNDQDVTAAPGPTIAIDDAVNWKYTVTNKGNVPLSNVNVTDNKVVVSQTHTGDTNGDSKLDTNETWVYTATGTATAGQYHNTSKATGEWVCKNVEATDDSWYYGETPGTPPTTPPEVGGTIYPIDKGMLLIPGIAIVVALLSCAFILVRRYQTQK
jgi:large repetitive protein